MIQKIFILKLLISLLFISSCSTGPEFKRDNETDPKSGDFKPDISALSAKLNNDKTVSLSWTDNSGFEDGIVIAKSFGDNEPIQIIDTLSANSVSYTDHSKLLDLHTTYHIGAFKDGANPVDTSFYISKKLEFGEIQGLNYTSEGNIISLNWESSVPYADKYLISKNVHGSSPVTIDTIDGKSIQYTFEEEDESYTMDITLAALLTNYEDKLVSVTQVKLDNVVYNKPSLTSVNVVNEAIVRISITDNSDFNDKFIVHERSRSAWHQPYSEFIPIDTISTSGNVFIPKNTNREREYAIEGIYKNEKSGLSEPKEIEFYSFPPFLGEDMFTSLSANSIKLSWEDINSTDPKRAETYHYELSLYNSESGELIKQIIIPPTETEYTFQNLDPSIKYEFILKTYNSSIPDPIAFSVQATLEEVNDFIISQNEGVNKAQIFPEREVVIFNQYQTGSPGLRIYDLNENSYHYIFDTGENPNEYEDKQIEDFSVSGNLELIATNRTVNDDITGEQTNFLYIVDRSSGTPAYFKKQGPDRTYSDETHLVGFISDSELIYTSTNPYTDDGFKVYKWNFYTNETEMIFERNYYYYTSSYIDNDKILIGAFLSLLVLNGDGSVIQEVHDPQLGEVNKIDPSSILDSYSLNISGRLYRYNIAANTIERLGEISRIKASFEVPQYNYIISRTEYNVVFLNLDSGSQVYKINDSERQLEFQNGAFLPNRDQVIFQHGERIKIFDLISTWVTTNFNCC